MDEIAAYVQAQPRKKFTKDNILVYQGEAPRSMYAIASGFVKIYDLSADGNEQMVGLAGKYDFIPSELLFSRDVAAQFFYAAFTDVEVYVIDRDELAERIRKDSEALYQIVQTVSAKYHGLRRHLTAVQKPRAREKIVYVLYFLALYFVSGSDRNMAPGTLQKVAIPLTQQDIANLVGISRETAAHELKHLKNEGYITYDKSAFYIRDTLDSLIA
jgi:CRP/FNR family transcriptional regulator